MVDKPQELSSKDFPEKSLGHRFPNFALFRDELRSRLGGVILKVVVKVSDDGKNYMDLAKSGEGLTSVSSQFGLGILWEFVARNFYYKYRGREYVGEQRDFVDEFMAELSFVVAEIRRKEHV